MKNQIALTLSITVGLLTLSCAQHRIGAPPHGEVGVANAPSSIPSNTVQNAGPLMDLTAGPNQKGVLIGAAGGVVGRIQTGLQNDVLPSRGNFARALTQVRSNLPKVTDVTKASGFDQAQLLVYAACSDLTTGTPSLMSSKYNVNPAATVSTNQVALQAAGKTMLDQHTAGLASQGPAAVQVDTILTNLIQTQVTGGSTSTVAFMAVCIAANTAGALMLGL